MSSYTTNIVADTCQRKQLGSSIIAILLGVFNKTIIPLALVEYEIVIANEALRASLAIYHLIANARTTCVSCWACSYAYVLP